MSKRQNLAGQALEAKNPTFAHRPCVTAIVVIKRWEWILASFPPAFRLYGRNG
jgi:hypothetical protein